MARRGNASAGEAAGDEEHRHLGGAWPALGGETCAARLCHTVEYQSYIHERVEVGSQHAVVHAHPPTHPRRERRDAIALGEIAPGMPARPAPPPPGPTGAGRDH